MPDVVHGFPYVEVQFAKDATLVAPAEVPAAVDMVRRQTLSDLLVFSHGWNNDMAEARQLYDRLLKAMNEARADDVLPGLAGRTFGVLAVFWPSKRFADEDLTPGHAASLTVATDRQLVEAMIDRLMGVFDAPDADDKLAKAKQLVQHLEKSPDKRREFVGLLRGLVHPVEGQNEDWSSRFASADGDELMRDLSTTGLDNTPIPGTGGAARIGQPTALTTAGGAAGLGNFFDGVVSAGRHLLNFTTYYQMKERAGHVGRDGLNPVLRTVMGQFPGLKVHLAGHSFGGRLVTAAADGPHGSLALTFRSMTLIQAAFSHYGFARNYDNAGHDGFFRNVVAHHTVSGPILVTCTKNDIAVGVAYAIASRIARQVAAALGDKHDKYGGIGRNGAQITPEATDGTLLPRTGTYAFQAGRLFNLTADQFIGGHSDIAKPEVGHAILAAVAAT